MNIKQLEAFVCVAESGSFSKAARELFLTQPTVSAHIASLEKELDARLFVRNTKEVKMSEGGKRLYKYAKQMVKLENEILENFKREPEQGRHQIRIAASTVPSQYLLPKLLARFRDKHPNEECIVIETDSAGVVNQVTENQVDVGFAGTVLDKRYCKYIPFYEDELIIVTPNNEKFQKLKQSETGVEWLKDEPIICREEGSGTRREAEKCLKQIGIDPESLKSAACIENPETVKRAVENGVGVSILSALSTQEEIMSGRLLGFSVGVENGKRMMNIVYNKNHWLSPATECFIKMAKSMYKNV